MTEAEQLIREHMSAAGVGNVAELHRLLVARGLEVSYDAVRTAVKRPARTRNPWLLETIAEVLGLSDAAMMELARTALYGKRA